MIEDIGRIFVPKRARSVDLESQEFLELQESIKEHGLLVPITVREVPSSEGGAFGHYLHLVCGARRLEACLSLGWKVINANRVNISDDTEALICELEENLRRKDFTWQEQMLASGKLFCRIRETDTDFTLEQFSQLMQQSIAKSSHDLDMFDHRFEFPTILLFNEWSRAREELRRLKVAKLAEEKLRRSVEAKTYREPSVDSQEENWGASPATVQSLASIPFTGDWIAESALGLLESLDDNCVDVVCTDPPFGINIQSSRHRRTQKQVYKDEYQDTKEEYLSLLSPCIPHFARVLKPGAHLYMFFGIENLHVIRELLEASDFLVNPVPLIWYRTGSGAAASQPYYLPGSAYQAIIFAFAPGERRRLQKQGQSNVITLPSVPPQKKVHPLEVPTHVYSDLISRSACKGDLMIDPFCGTGNSLVAGLQCYCRVRGAEIRPDYRNLAILNLEERLRWEAELEAQRGALNEQKT